MKEALKNIVRRIVYGVSFLCLLPFFLLHRTHLASFLTMSIVLSYLPGWPGMFTRRVWYKLNLRKCGKNLFVDFGGVFRTRKATAGDNVYVGMHCLVGEVDLGDNVTISHQSFIMSERSQHGLSRSKPMNQQIKKNLERTKIGDDVWICLNCVIATDVARGTVVGANSFVNKTFDEYSIIAGSPARFIKKRPE